MIKVKLINLNINFTLFTLFTQFKKEIKELDTNNKSPQIEKENGRNQINSKEIDQKQNSNDNTLFDNNLPYTPIIFPFFKIFLATSLPYHFLAIIVPEKSSSIFPVVLWLISKLCFAK